MDRLSEIRQRTEAAKAQKEKGDSITAACIAWSIVTNDIPYLLSEVGRLTAQLAESRRREQAAVKDIEKMMRICEKGSCHFCANGDCTESPYCSPKWRGPMAGKGEAK